MIAVAHSAYCWCGRAQSVVRGCLFHAGDLEQRVGRLMRAVRVIDIEDDFERSGTTKWLAFLCASIGWHLLPRSTAPVVGYSDARQLGRLDVIVTPDVWQARQAITAEESSALHAEAVMGRWPWSAS